MKTVTTSPGLPYIGHWELRKISKISAKHGRKMATPLQPCYVHHQHVGIRPTVVANQVR